MRDHNPTMRRRQLWGVLAASALVLTLVPAAQAATPTPQASAHAQHLPPPGRWHYQVKGQTKGLSYQAESQLHWQHDGQHYRAHMALHALWLQRTQTSTGALTPAGLQPEHFIDQEIGRAHV